VHFIQVLCQYRLYRAAHAYLTILRYNGSLVIWTTVSLATAKFKPLIFSMSRFALSSTANIFSLMFSRTSACCLNNFIIQSYVQKVTNSVKIADLCAHWRGEPCFVGASARTAQKISSIIARCSPVAG
jgi:hypothetical protein